MNLKKAVIGIDIGGTNTEIAYINKEAEILIKKTIPTKGYNNLLEYINTLCAEISNLTDSKKDSHKFSGIGIGVPNGNYYTGKVEYAPNLGWGDNVPLVKMIKEYFDLPIFITNDANAAALGEMVFGGAKNMKDFIVITLGTGLGSGFVTNGKLILGHDGFAGEMGHITVKENGRNCACGKKGCLETYVSATGIKRTVYELLAHYNNESPLKDIAFNKLEAKDIYNFAKQGDFIALQAFDYTAEILGKAIANVVALTSPEAIFLFGGLANANDLLIQPVKKYMEKSLLKVFQNKVEILPSELMNKNAAVIGAAAMVMDKIKL